MAVSKMLKFQLIGHSSCKEAVVSSLREMGAVQINDSREKLAGIGEDEIYGLSEPVAESDGAETRLNKLQHIIEYMKPYEEKPKGIEALLNPKLLVTEAEIAKTLEEFDIDGTYEKCINNERQSSSAEAEIARKRSLIDDLRPWETLDVPLEEIAETKQVRISLAIAESKSFLEQSDQAPSGTHIHVVSTTKTHVYMIALYPKDEEDVVLDSFKQRNWRLIDFGDLKGAPSDVIDRLKKEIEETNQQLLALEDKGKEIAAEKPKVAILYDHFSELLAKSGVQDNFVHTSETFALEGWLRERDADTVRGRLEKISNEIELTMTDPGEGDEVPIDLENKPLTAPFEFVTTLYGRPVYTEYDPTPLLAPFFILFFGLCVTDAGYGLTVAALSFFAMKKLKLGEGTAKLFKLMFFGGLVTGLVGALTGGWYGMENIGPLGKIVIINPLKDPMSMLYFVFALGVLHLFFGLGIKMYASIRSGEVGEAILDQGVWLALLASLLPLGCSFILGIEVNEDILSISRMGAVLFCILLVFSDAILAQWLWIIFAMLTVGLLYDMAGWFELPPAIIWGGLAVCFVVITAMDIRTDKLTLPVALKGIFKLYGITGYFGDVLSYARLLALGLATSAIAMAINGVAETAMGIPFYIGYLVALCVLIGGHTFNIAVNCLGGFVHSGRLQYLEFFSKFFEGGGTEFRPFKEEKKYTVLQR